MADHDLDALRDLSERYAFGADSDDAALYTSAFLPDGRLFVHDPGEGPAVRSRTGHEQLGAVPGMLRRYDTTFHLIGNRRYTISPDATTASGSVYCIANHVTRATGTNGGTTGGTNYVMHIRYDDDYERNPDGEWRIAERHCRVMFTETRPIDAPTT